MGVPDLLLQWHVELVITLFSLKVQGSTRSDECTGSDELICVGNLAQTSDSSMGAVTLAATPNQKP